MKKAEEQFIKAFILPSKRDRYITKLSSKKGRRKFTDRFCHSLDYDPRFASIIELSNKGADEIYDSLKSKGAPDKCHIISDLEELDAREMSLKAALREVVGYNSGTVIICIPGKLAYYEGEDVKARYILSK